MSEAVRKYQQDDDISVIFNIEADEVMAIGEKMQAINDQAYMNGYNWDAFINYYLQITRPDLLDGLGSDPEAGTYIALYEAENERKADQLVPLINMLIAEPDKILQFVHEYGNSIDWD